MYIKTCTDLFFSYFQFSQIEINECASYPCEHGGTCEDEVNGFECSCTPGWTGNMCEQRINNCVGKDCGNDGECISLAESAFCRY